MKARIVVFMLAVAVLGSWSVVFSQEPVERYTLVLQLTDDYEWAQRLAERASQTLNLELQLGNISYSKEYGRITSDTCESITNCSAVERFQPGEYISLGNSRDYRIEGSPQIAIIAGLYEGPNSADYALQRVKPLYKNAFIQVDTGYPTE